MTVIVQNHQKIYWLLESYHYKTQPRLSIKLEIFTE